MSDFGTRLDVYRQDGQNVGDSDRALLDIAIESARAAGPYEDALSDPFLFRVVNTTALGGCRGFAVLLSEYGLEYTEEEGMEPDALLAHDRSLAERVLSAVQPQLGRDYVLQVIADHW